MDSNYQGRKRRQYQNNQNPGFQQQQIQTGLTQGTPMYSPYTAQGSQPMFSLPVVSASPAYLTQLSQLQQMYPSIITPGVSNQNVSLSPEKAQQLTSQVAIQTLPTNQFQGQYQNSSLGVNVRPAIQDENSSLLKVSSTSNPNGSAGSIAHTIRRGMEPTVLSTGTASINQAVKALAVARGFLAESGMDLIVVPSFREVRGGDKIAFQVQRTFEQSNVGLTAASAAALAAQAQSSLTQALSGDSAPVFSHHTINPVRQEVDKDAKTLTPPKTMVRSSSADALTKESTPKTYTTCETAVDSSKHVSTPSSAVAPRHLASNPSTTTTSALLSTLPAATVPQDHDVDDDEYVYGDLLPDEDHVDATTNDQMSMTQSNSYLGSNNSSSSVSMSTVSPHQRSMDTSPNSDLRVSHTSSYGVVAGAIAKKVRAGGLPTVTCIGPRAVSISVSALIQARVYLRDAGMDIGFQPEFIHLHINNDFRSGIRFITKLLQSTATTTTPATTQVSAATSAGLLPQPGTVHVSAPMTLQQIQSLQYQFQQFQPFQSHPNLVAFMNPTATGATNANTDTMPQLQGVNNTSLHNPHPSRVPNPLGLSPTPTTPQVLSPSLPQPHMQPHQQQQRTPHVPVISTYNMNQRY